VRHGLERRPERGLASFAHERRRNPVSAPDFEYPVIRLYAEPLDDQSQSFVHEEKSEFAPRSLIALSSGSI